MENGKKLRRRDDFPLEKETKEWADKFGRKELRFSNAYVNDCMMLAGYHKIWNSYPANVMEEVMYADGLPRNFYYNSYDVDYEQLVFFAQDQIKINRMMKLRWKINAWLIKRGW